MFDSSVACDLPNKTTLITLARAAQEHFEQQIDLLQATARQQVGPNHSSMLCPVMYRYQFS